MLNSDNRPNRNPPVDKIITAKSTLWTVSSDGNVISQLNDVAPPSLDSKVIFVTSRTESLISNGANRTHSRPWQNMANRVPIFFDFARQVINKLFRYNKIKKLPKTISEPTTRIIPKDAMHQEPIAIIGMNWLDVGGAEAFAVDSAELASKQGYRVIIICDKTGPLFWLSKVERFVFRVYMLGELQGETLSTVCYSLIKHYNPELIHIHHCLTIYKLLPTLGFNRDKCCIVDTTHIIENRHGGFVAESQRYSPWIDCHHVISKELFDCYIWAGIPRSKIKLGYIVKPIVARGSEQPPKCVKTFFQIGFVGRFVQQKRPYLFIELAKRLHSEQPNTFSFEMVGDGLLFESCSKKIQRDKIPVTIYPPRTNVREFLLRTNVLIICSDLEGLSLVTYEAIQCGCIVISADVGAQREIIDRPMLVSSSPFKFLSQSEMLIKELKDDIRLRKEILELQYARYRDVCSKPNAADICTEIYKLAKRLNA